MSIGFMAAGVVGGALLGSMGGSDVDMSGQNQAALETAQLSREQLDWAKQVYREEAPMRQAVTNRAMEISDAQLASMKQSDRIAGETDAYQKTTFRPLEQKLVADAQTYDTAARRAEESARATAGIETQLSAQRAATIQDMQRRSVNPSSSKMLALQGTMDLQAAKLKTGASSAAVDKVEQLGYSRQMDAASLGRNLATDRVNATNAAITAGNASNANGQTGLNVNAQAASGVSGAYGTAINGMTQAGSQYNAINTLASKDDGTAAMLGQLGGAAISMYSDVNMKKDIAPIDEDEALQAVADTPVSSWAYKAGTMGEQEEGSDRKVGPMAQDLNANMGEDVAPGGKKIDLVSMNGTLMAAVKALNKKVDALASGGTMAVAA